MSGFDEGKYGELAQLMGQIVDEAINSTMRWMRFSGTVDTGFHGVDPEGNSIDITPLGGRYEGSSFVPGGVVTEGPEKNNYLLHFEPGWPFDDLPSMVKYYSDTINNLFMPWLQLPDPAAFQGAVDSAKSATTAMSYSPIPAAVAKTVDGTPPLPIPGNSGLSHVTSLGGKAATLKGMAMDTFYDDYAVRLPQVIDNQASVAFMIWVGVAGEQNVWAKARKSISSIAEQAVEAMKSATGEGGGGGWEAILNVLGAVALIAAPFTDGLSEAGFAAATAANAEKGLNAVGVVMQTSSDFISEPQEEEKPPLSSNTPVGVCDNIADAIDKLNKEIKTEETNLSNGMRSLATLITDQSGNWAMVSPAILEDDNPDDFGTRGKHGQIAAEYSDIHYLADTIIDGEVVPIFKGARNDLEGAEGAGAWSRPGSIGSGATGPYTDWWNTASILAEYIGDSATQLTQAASVLVKVAADFKKTDAQIRSDLDGLTKKVVDGTKYVTY